MAETEETKQERSRRMKNARSRAYYHRTIPTRRAYYEANRDSRRSGHLLRTYGITLADYESMLAMQGGCGAHCGRLRNTGTKAWPVDHCHTTRHVRAILCHECNKALGHANDDPEILRKLADYLEHHRAKNTG